MCSKVHAYSLTLDARQDFKKNWDAKLALSPIGTFNSGCGGYISIKSKSF